MHVLLVMLGSFAYAVAGALIPVLNTEVSAIAVPAATRVDPLLVAVALAAGQTLGKLPYWLAGRGAERWARLLPAEDAAPDRAAPRIPMSRILRRLGGAVRRLGAGLAAWGRGEPWRLVAVTFVSALTGIPPFVAWPAVVGAIDPRWWRFAVPALTGRTLLFWGLAVAPHLVPGVF